MVLVMWGICSRASPSPLSPPSSIIIFSRYHQMPPLSTYLHAMRCSPEREITKKMHHISVNTKAVKEEMRTEITRFQQNTDHAYFDLEQEMTMETLCVSVADRISECEKGVRNLQVITAKGHDIIEECQTVMASQQKRVEGLKQVMNNMVEMFALRQVCSAFRDKLFREVAGERVKKWEDLYINNFQGLEEQTMRDDISDHNDRTFFRQRWTNLRKQLGIHESERMLRGMYSMCVEDGNGFAHAAYSYSMEELQAYALHKCNKPQVSRALRRFLELNAKLSDLRHKESIYECDWSTFAITDLP